MPNNFNFAQQEDPETYNKVQAERQQAQQEQGFRKVNTIPTQQVEPVINVEDETEYGNRVARNNKRLEEVKSRQGIGGSIADAAKSGLATIGAMASSIPAGIIDTYGSMNESNTGALGALGIAADWLKDMKIGDGKSLASQYLTKTLGAPLNLQSELEELSKNPVDAEEIGKRTEKYLGLPEEYNPLSPNNGAVEYLLKVAKTNDERAKKGYSGGISQAISDGNYKDAWKLTAINTVQSLPIMLGLVAARGAGASEGISLAGLGVGSAETEYKKLKEENPNIDRNLLKLNAQLTGLGEAGSEIVGTSLLYNQGRRLFQSGAREEAETVIKNGVEQFLNTAFKRSFVGAAALADSGGEMANQVWKNATDKWSGVDPDRDYTDGVIDAGIISLATTGGVAGVTKGLASVIKPKAKATVAADIQNIEQINADIENPDIDDATKAALLEQSGNLTEKVNDEIEKDEKETSKLTPEQQLEAVKINTNIDELQAIVDNPNVSETTKKVIQTQIDDLTKQVDAIKPEESAKEAVQETKTPEPTETTTEVKETIVEPDSKPVEIDTFTEPSQITNEIKQPEVATEEVVEEDLSQKRNEEVLAKAETDLAALKQVNDKTKKYEASMKRLTEAKNNKEITTTEFNDLKKRFDDVIGESKPKIKEELTDAVQIESTAGVDVRQPSEDGSEMEQGNTQGQEVTGETGTQEIPVITEEETLKSTPDKPTTGITLEQSAQNREELGLEAYEKSIKTDKELNRKADAALKEGYNITGLINRLQKGALPTDLEQVIARKYVSSLEAVNNKNPSNENIAKIREIRNALDTQRSELGRALRAGSGEILVEDNLSNFLMDEMDAIGVTELSESAINDLKDKYEKGQTAKEAYEEGYQKALDEFTKQQAELELAKIKKPRTSTGKKKTAAEYADERKSYKENIRRKLKEARSQANAVPIPYLNELIAISPEVAKLVKSYVEEGISKLDDIITKVHDDLKEDIEGITEEDVRDLIAGVYNKKRPTKDQLAATLRDLRQQAKLLKRLDDLENGIQPKTEREKIQKSKSVESLQKQIKEIEDRVGITDEKSLKARRTSLENKIKQLKEDLELGNFDLEPAQPRKLRLDEETQKAQDEYIEFLKETNRRRDQAKYEQLSGFRKAWDKFHQILGLKRLVQTSLDFSMPFRQGIVISLNPRRYGIGFKNFRSLEGLYNTPSDIKNSPAIQSWTNMFKSTFSEKYYDRFMFQIKSDPQYRDMLEDKMIFSEVDSADNLKREEDFRTSFLYKIPYLNIPFLASNRAAAGFVNTARYELYKQGTVRLQEQGVTRENSPESYKELAKWAMNATGRGNMLEFLENSPQGQRILGDTFYGARLMSSRFNLLNPNYYAKMPKEVRVEALKDMAGLASTIAVTLLAATAAGATVSLNPDDSDFLKAKWGNKRYDITGGMSQYMRTFFRLLKAAVLRVNPAIYGKNKDKGKLAYANKYGAFSVKAGVSFFRYKLAPNTSYVLSGLMGKDPLGEDFDPQEILNIYPMYTEDLKDALKKEDMATAGMTILIPNLFGIGVQEYWNEKKK